MLLTMPVIMNADELLPRFVLQRARALKVDFGA
jgi:hypothetical protein